MEFKKYDPKARKHVIFKEAKITIDLVENLGSARIFYTHVNGTEIRIKSSQNIKDKNITIYLPKNKLYLFDDIKNRISN